MKKHRFKKRIICTITHPAAQPTNPRNIEVLLTRKLPYEALATSRSNSTAITNNSHFRNRRSASQPVHPLRQYQHNVGPEPFPDVKHDRDRPGEPATRSTAAARREESRRGQERRRHSLRQPFRRHHEPGKPEAVFFQAEADQQVCMHTDWGSP